MLLAQQKLSMLKALEEQSLQASMLPIIPSPIVDSDDEEPLHAPQIAADSFSFECIRLKFMSKTKQQVVVQPYSHASFCAPNRRIQSLNVEESGRRRSRA
jgi:hypothetical protein